MSTLYEIAERLMRNTPAAFVLENVGDWNELLLGLKEAKL